MDDFTHREDQELPPEEPSTPNERAPSPDDTQAIEPTGAEQLSLGVEGEHGAPPTGYPAAPEDDADITEPYEAPPEDEHHADREPRRAATVVALGVVVMAVVGVFAIIVAGRLYFERKGAVQTLDMCVTSLSDLAATSGTPDALRRRLAWLESSVEKRDYKQAQMAIAGLTDLQLGVEPPVAPLTGTEPGASEAPPGKMPSPLEAKDLPEGAKKFFADNPDLWKAFLGFARTGLRLREGGLNVDDLRSIRESIIEAARLGQTDRVTQLLGKARDLIKAKTGEDIPDEIKGQLAEFGKAFNQARREHRDVRPAATLAERAQRAAQRGDLPKARELIDKAITALKNARRMGPPRRRPEPRRAERNRPDQPPIAFLEYVANSLMEVMHAEDNDLARVWKSVNTAAGAVREKNAEQVREILGGAMRALQSIGIRRRMLTKDIGEKEKQASGPREGRGKRPKPPSREEMVKEVRGRIGDVLAEVRKLSDEDFERYKDKFAEELVNAVLAPGPRPPGVGLGAGARAERPMSVEERTRAKMQMAAEPYLRLKRTDADTTELDARFQEARQALAEGDYAEAEQIVDGSLEMMDKLLNHKQPAREPPLTRHGEGGPLEYSTPITDSGDSKSPSPQEDNQ